jgi:hypothetical protein
LGSVGLFGAIDGAFILSKNGGVGTIWSSHRYGLSLEKTSFRYDNKKVIQYEGTKSEITEREVSHAIYRTLLELESSNRTELYNSVGGNHQQFLDTLDSMVKSETLKKSGKGAKNSEFRYSILDFTFLEGVKNLNSLPALEPEGMV